MIYGVVGLTCLLVAGCSEKIESGAVKPSAVQSIKAMVATVAIRSESISYEMTGTVTADADSTLSSKIMGVVKSVHVREGDRVRKDRVLVDIDPRQVKAQLQQVEAGLSEARKAESAAISAQGAARANADLSKATFDRYANLMKSESASRQEFDEISARHRQAEAALGQAGSMVDAARFRVQQAEAAVAAAGVSENDAKLVAPFDGVISARLVDPGSLAAPGAPLLKIQSTDVFRVDMVVPESMLQCIVQNQTVSVAVPAAGLTIPGTVYAIFPAADASSRSFTVQVAIAAHPAVHAGMFSRVTIPGGQQNQLMIPSSAVLHQGQLTGIFLLDGDHIARFRLLRTGRTSGNSIEVLSGLRSGDLYVVEPPPNLVDGLRVEVSS
jgi:multidrug efflux pump subunit AcrA (membrane-fusion protein)